MEKTLSFKKLREMQSGDVHIMFGEKKRQGNTLKIKRKIHISCMLTELGTTSGTTDHQAKTLMKTIRWIDVVRMCDIFFLSYEEVLGKDHVTGSTCISKCFVTYSLG